MVAVWCCCCMQQNQCKILKVSFKNKTHFPLFKGFHWFKCNSSTVDKLNYSRVERVEERQR